ncbi:MAG: transposase, partial [Terricaulis sp.]
MALYETSGRKLAAVAAELDVHETVLRDWIRQLGAGAAASPASRAVSSA